MEKRILYIDDCPADLFIAKAILEQKIDCHDRYCPQLIKVRDYHLIIIDINLNGESGYLLYKKLKEKTSAKFIMTSDLIPVYNMSISSKDELMSKRKLFEYMEKIKNGQAN